jgi:chlorophyllide a reductase subunit Y
MGAAGPAALAHIINTTIANKARFDRMDAFFGDVGRKEQAGIWTPGTAQAAGLISAGAASC